MSCSEGSCETNAATKHQEHTSAQKSGAIPERGSQMPGCLRQTSGTINRGRLLRQRLGRVCEDPMVDFVFVRDAWWASPWARCTKTRRLTSSSYVMLGDHLVASSATTQNVVATSSGEAEFYSLTKSASRAPRRSGHGCRHGKSRQTMRASGRHSVEGDCLKTRSRTSETSPYPSLVGCRKRRHAES